VTDATTDTVSQRTLAGGPQFRFHADHLEYFGIDRDFRTRYEHISGPGGYRRQKTSDKLTTFVSAYLIFLFLAILFRDPNPHYGAEGLSWAVRALGGVIAAVAAICVPLHYLTHKEFTVIPARNGGLLVVRDKQHDAIISKLQAARLKSLRALAAPDPANSPDEELAKLRLLREEGAITDEECLRLSSQISGASSDV
jgi:hypothetical protein